MIVDSLEDINEHEPNVVFARGFTESCASAMGRVIYVVARRFGMAPEKSSTSLEDYRCCPSRSTPPSYRSTRTLLRLSTLLRLKPVLWLSLKDYQGLDLCQAVSPFSIFSRRLITNYYHAYCYMMQLERRWAISLFD